MEHLKRSFNFTATHKGPHGLPLIGRADWNDCLNLNCFSAEPGESFQTFGPSEGPVAESVFIAGMFVKYGEEYAQLVSLLGNAVEADRARKEVAAVYQAVLDSGWDGEWFLRAYDAYSHKVGSRECEEGQIFIEPQGFCVLAGIGVQEGLAQKALDSVKKRLDTKYGVMLLQPAYTRYHLELGEVSSYPPGYKEMPESSATIIPGFPSQKPSSAEAAAHLRYIVKPVPLIWKISVTSTAQSLTFTHRWLPAQTLPDTVKQKTAG